MKYAYFILFFVFFVYVESCLCQDVKFLDNVVHPDRVNTYIVVGIESKSFSGKIVINNSDMVYILSVKKGIKDDRYKEYLLPFIRDKIGIPIKGVSFRKQSVFIKIKGLKLFGIRPLIDVEFVDELAKKGCREFIKFYFDEDFHFRKRLDIDQTNAVINKLFQWGISTSLRQGVIFIGKDEAKCSN